MSTITMRVCEECGMRYVGEGGSLIVKSMQIQSAKPDDMLLDSEKELDFCSQGCFMRYTSKHLEKAITNHLRREHKEEQKKTEGGNGHESKPDGDLLRVA